MQKPHLVATDVDGTLLDPLDAVSERTRAVVHRVVADGVPFVLATGRPPRWIAPVTEQIGYAGLAICGNGAVLYDAATDEVRWATALDPMLLRDAGDAIREVLPEAMIAVERVPVNGSADIPGEQFVAEFDYNHPWADTESEKVARAEVLGKPAIKLLVRQAGAPSDVMAAAIREVLGDAVDVTYSTGHGLVELSAPGVTKGSALARVAAELGIEAANVLAFGDMHNDLPMLRWAGCGVAMGNASADVAEAADEVTAPHDEDGLALVLERWF